MSDWEDYLDEREPEWDDWDYHDIGGDDCFHCGGDGWVECPHPMECTCQHETYETADGYVGQLCSCGSCGGSGRAKDMTIW